MQYMSEAAKWHLYRARRMEKQGSQVIRNLRCEGRRRSFYWVFTILAVQLSIAFYIEQLSWGYILLFSGTIGSYLAWGLHCALHEISHGSAYTTGVPWRRATLLRLSAMTYPDVSLYAYYRWQHMSHHSQLAGNSVDEAKLAERIDADVLAVQNFYAVKIADDVRSTTWVEAAFRGRYYRPLLGMIPLWEFCINTLAFIRHAVTWPNPILWPKSYKGRNINRLFRARRSIAGQLLLVFLFQASILTLSGFGAFSYLLLSFLFIKGLLFHPYILFWLTEHKTTQHQNFCQPTTSIYHWTADWLFWGMNHHVEHHDFPQVAARHLKILNKVFSEQYGTLFKFTSLVEVYKIIFYADKPWIYGCQCASNKIPLTRDPNTVRCT